MTLKKMTTVQAIDQATAKLSQDIADFTSMRESALSSFNAAAAKLTEANAGLLDRIGKLENLAAAIDTLKGEANRAVEVNDATLEQIKKITGG